MGSTPPFNLELAGTISKQSNSLAASDFFSCDAKLLLLCISIIRECGFRAIRLEEHAQKISDAVRKCGDGHDDVGLTMALHRLGLAGWPSSDVTQVIFRRSTIDLMASSPEEIRDIYNAICTATYFGTRRYPDGLQRRKIEYAVKVLLTDALRSYDISTGATLLRAAAYLGMAGDSVFQNAISFLRLQQLLDGRFGQYDLVAKRLTDSGLDPCLDMYLPLTVSCIWSLSESEGSTFRLFAS
jgi:hypothetical protein